jgi:hypothetical protein
MRIAAAVTLICALLGAACSSGDEQAARQAPTGDHVWKDQVGALDEAKAAEQAVKDAAAKQAEAVREQSE